MSTTSNNNNNNNNNQSTTSSSSTASHQEAAHRQKIQEQFNHHVKNFVVDLEFPAQVKNAKHQDNNNNNDSPSSLRTSPDIVQHRLLESGVLFTNTQTVGELTDRIADFVQNMERSGCFHAVQVKIGGTADDDHHRNHHHHTRESSSSADGKFPPPPPERLQVILNERNWYRLYIGGGLKQDGLLSLNSTSTSDSTLLVPKVQLEASGKLLNLTGNLDVTSLQYTIDQTSCACLSFLHERPLFSFLPDEPGGLRSSLLESSNGSQISLAFRAHLDTVDHEWTRSYKEYQRLLGIRIANSCNVTHPEMSPTTYSGMDWTILYRDVIPKRHSTYPYLCDASPEIVHESSSSLKHSLLYEYRTNGTYTNHRFTPTQGMDCKFTGELAGPPGDVGFVKCSGGISWNHEPPTAAWTNPNNNTTTTTTTTNNKTARVAIHSSFHAGILYPLSFGGSCGPPTVSDRFFVGGPTQSLRGFLPAGIGPRAKSGGSTVPGGDALGGDFFYAATLAASIPFPGWPLLSNNGVRLFGFTNFGTLTALQPSTMNDILKSTRLAAGGGIVAATPLGRLECTYAVPLRYSPRDARRSVQVGFGFSFE